MDENQNVQLPPERSGDEELPLIPLSPALNRRLRAQALSQLSLQSPGSLDELDAAIVENGDLMVGVETALH